jgi:septal ring factor EnvC (AmiA/AmiB activator)
MLKEKKKLTEILKQSNQIYKNIGLDNDKFIELSEDIKDLNTAKNEMFESIRGLVNEDDNYDIENELKELEKENLKENDEFPFAPEIPVNPFTEEQQKLYQTK